SMMHFLNKVAEHRFGDLEVSNYAIFHGPNGHDVSRGAAQHPFGLFADGQDVGGARLNSDHGRLAEDNSLVTYIDQRVGCAQIDANIVGKQALKLREHEWCLTRGESRSIAHHRSSAKAQIENREERWIEAKHG